MAMHKLRNWLMDDSVRDRGLIPDAVNMDSARRQISHYL